MAFSVHYGPIDAGLLAAEPVVTPTAFLYLPFVAKNLLPTLGPPDVLFDIQLVYLPLVAKNLLPTPTPPILYEGLTDQERPISLEVEPDFSAVRRITIEFGFSCGGMSRDVKSVSPVPGLVQDRFFAMEFLYVAVKGSFDALSPRKQSESNLCPKKGDNASAADFNSVEGTWQGIMPNPWQPGRELCRGPVGTWSASRK